MNDGEDRLDQPEVFELELELLRWVKKAVVETIPPIMQKPAGNVAQHYGLDSKSRWREAVCVMMILSDPAITLDGVSKLGRQMAQLFRQDYQLWDVKAKQLKSWVERGLLNVKLLDRTLAYFQNQSSWLQYIKTLKKPVPKIESPGFPGTQWNEFYWKDQTVMLLMQEADFPDGKNPEFCAKLFKEEPGKWRLKMEQFKRWIEKGKNDPLPEYYGTGKNCAECGVFLWDTRSYLKHMKRNHGYKIKEKDKQMIKNDKRDKPEKCEEDSLNADKFEQILETAQDKTDKNISMPPDQKIQDSRSKDSFDSIFKGDTSKCNSLDNLLASESEKNESDLDEKAVKVDKVAKVPEVENKPEADTSAPLRRRAAQKTAIKDAMVSCPECDFQCLHSKIVSHLKRCTKKAAQAKKKANSQTGKSTLNPKSDKKQAKSSVPRENVEEKEKMHESIFEFNSEPEVKKHKESDIVKKVFLKKFEAQKSLERKKNKYEDLSDDSFSQKGDSYSQKFDLFSEKDDSEESNQVTENQSPVRKRKKIKYDDLSDDSLSLRNESFSKKEDLFSKKEDSFSKNEDSCSKKEDSFSKKDDSFSLKDDLFSAKDNSFLEKDDLEKNSQLTEKLPVRRKKKNKYDDLSDDSFSQKEDSFSQKDVPLSHMDVPLSQKDDSFSQKDDSFPQRDDVFYQKDDSFSKKDLTEKSPQLTEKQPPLKLKLSRKEFSSEKSHFEVSVKKDEIDAVFGKSLKFKKNISDKSNQPTILLKNINTISKKDYGDAHKILQSTKQETKRIYDPEKATHSIEPSDLKNNTVSQVRPTKVFDDWDDHSDISSSKLKDDSSEDEIMPQKSKRIKGFLESFKPVHTKGMKSDLNNMINKKPQEKTNESEYLYEEEDTNKTPIKKSKEDKKERSKSRKETKEIEQVHISPSQAKDDSSEDEVIPQKSKRGKGFLESFKPLQNAEVDNFKDKKTQDSVRPTDDSNGEEIHVLKSKKKEESLEVDDNVQNTNVSLKVDEKSKMKNKWLESLEKRSKGKGQTLDLAPAKPTKNSLEVDKTNILDNDTSQKKNINPVSKQENEKKKNNVENQNISSKEIQAPEKASEIMNICEVADKSDESNKSLLNPATVDFPMIDKSKRVLPELYESQEGRPSLRRGKMIPCPLCGVEYAIASNLQKHIDKDHSEGDDRSHNKRKSKDKADPARKKKKVDDDPDIYDDPRPGPSGSKKLNPQKKSDEADKILEKTRTSNMEVDLDNPEIPVMKEKENEEDKLTEYEIFQKLQLKEPSKSDRKKVECNECGLYLPTNTIKRHLLKHEKNALKAQLIAENPKPAKEKKEKKVPCPECNKMFPPNTIKKHMVKHRKENKEDESIKENEDSEQNNHESEEFADERIPCKECGKMLPKNAMKRHLMKHETVSQESDSEKISSDQKTLENNTEEFEEEKPKSARKKVTCVECGLMCAPNVIKRHLEKHAKMKARTQNEIYAPIEITPTKEYWEYEKEKSSTKGIKSDLIKTMNKVQKEKNSDSEQSQEEDDSEITQPKKPKEGKKDRSKSRKEPKDMEPRELKEAEPVHKTVTDLKEAEKAKNSEEESESENPLETAVRKVVSYRMTPKQALSIYNLTPKVLFDNLLGETDNDRMSILKKVNLSSSGEKKVINYCKQNEAQLSYKAVINCVRDLKIKDDFPDFSLSRLEAYRWWYAFRKKFDLKITAKKK